MSRYPNAIAVARLLLQSLSVKHSLSGLTHKLEDHPEYPSLLAVSDCLTEWNIANAALNVDKTDYSTINCPFIAHFTNNTFVLVYAVHDKEIIYSDEKKQKAVLPTKEFLQKWSGTVLLAEANEESKEAEYAENRWIDIFRNAQLPILITALLVGITLAIVNTSLTLSYFILLVINLLGISITSLLLINSIDNNNPLVQNLCSLGSKNGCNAILKSDAAKLSSWLSWSEVGFFYFAGSAITLLINPTALPIITCLNLLALPYTVYSVTYQYRHKNWCVMCCMVQALLVFANIITLSFGLWPFDFNLSIFSFSFFAQIAFSFLLPITLWYTLKPFFTSSVQFKPLKQQLKKFKYNSELFNQVLVNQPRYAVNNELMPIVLGNPAAETIITMVSNPFCGPCATAHKTIEEWLQYRDDLQMKIIFTTADHDDDEKTKVSRHINALTTLNDAQLLENALNDWYEQRIKKYETWAKKYPVVFNGEMNVVTEKQKQWCEMAEITFTPTILVNGYKLPEPYRLEDIKYLIN